MRFNNLLKKLLENENNKEKLLLYKSLIRIPKTKRIKDLDLQDFEFYRNYLRFFSTVEYNVPEGLETDFDWNLLYKFVVASLASRYEIKNENNKTELYITVTVRASKKDVTRKVSELRSDQIHRIFEIYTVEQITIGTYLYEDYYDTPIYNSSLKNNQVPLKSDYVSLYSNEVLNGSGAYHIFERHHKLIANKKKIFYLDYDTEIKSIFKQRYDDQIINSVKKSEIVKKRYEKLLEFLSKNNNI